MAEPRSILGVTADAAAFAAREYFRPLLAVSRFLTSSAKESAVPKAVPEHQANLEEAKAVLRESLAKSRRHERLLLTQCVVSALASVLAVAISTLRVLQLESALFTAAILPVSIFTIWTAFRVVKNREMIIEQRTVYRLMKSLDHDTAQRVVKQIVWGRPSPRGPSRRKNRHPLS